MWAMVDVFVAFIISGQRLSYNIGWSFCYFLRGTMISVALFFVKKKVLDTLALTLHCILWFSPYFPSDHPTTWHWDSAKHRGEPGAVAGRLGYRESRGRLTPQWPPCWDVWEVFHQAVSLHAGQGHEPSITNQLHSDSHAWCFSWLHGRGF